MGRRFMGQIQLPVFVNGSEFAEAEALINSFGVQAGLEAANRADESRAEGNRLNYCKWRQVERMCVLMSIDVPLGTIH